jgi:hypothetical protein
MIPTPEIVHQDTNLPINPRGKPPLNLVQLLPFELALPIRHAPLHHLHSIFSELAGVTLEPEIIGDRTQIPSLHMSTAGLCCSVHDICM